MTYMVICATKTKLASGFGIWVGTVGNFLTFLVVDRSMTTSQVNKLFELLYAYRTQTRQLANALYTAK